MTTRKGPATGYPRSHASKRWSAAPIGYVLSICRFCQIEKVIRSRIATKARLSSMAMLRNVPCSDISRRENGVGMATDGGSQVLELVCLPYRSGNVNDGLSHLCLRTRILRTGVRGFSSIQKYPTT